MQRISQLVLTALFCWAINIGNLWAQTVDTAVARQLLLSKDTVVKPTIENPAFKETDSAKLRDPNARTPRVAALRSAIVPGWGQVYNRKIWKVPIVYAALGITGGIFVNNLTWYNRTKDAYKVAYSIVSKRDSTGYDKINADIRRVFFEQPPGGVQPDWLRTNRDYYRKNLDYAAIYFLIAWALNVVDATVDAHLSSFDISPDLSFKVQPGYSDMAKTAGVSFIVKVR